MTYVVTQPCCNDATCVSVCPVNCIHPTPDEPDYATSELLYIDPNGCIDCGACVDVCPVDAIVPDFDLTDETMRYAEINAHYFADPARRDYPATLQERNRPKVETIGERPLRVAVVGSGPAACYAAEDLLARRDLAVEVHMFERLPTPWGLVRYGVAPDHQGTKAVGKLFTRTAGRPGMDFHLNVEVGEHIGHDELLEHHHAVIYAVGAAADRELGVGGEHLPGSRSATEFVAWYNGHPGHAERTFDLSGKRAVVVGNGNVALDVARILASDADQLARTDIADHALEALRASRISEVVVLGRRGPAQAAFTTPELLGLAGTPGLDVVVDPADLADTPGTPDPGSMAALKAAVVGELSDATPSGAGKRIELRFFAAPLEVLGDSAVTGVRVARTELAADGRPRPTGETEDIDCDLLLRAVGYRGRAVPGLPFDDDRGVVPHDAGRVVDADGEPLPGVYTAGWIKRGPSGVIGTNKKCAEDTVTALLDDYVAGRLTAPAKGRDDLRDLVARRRPEALTFQDWKTIDKHERAQARPQRRPRVKLVDVERMVEVAVQGRRTGAG